MLNKIILLQKKFVRFIAKEDYFSLTKILFRNLHILKVSNLYEDQVNIYTFKVKHNLLPLNNICISFTQNVGYNLRNIGEIQHHYCRTSLRQRFITFSSINLWNVLPLEVKNLVTLSAFKKRCI